VFKKIDSSTRRSGRKSGNEDEEPESKGFVEYESFLNRGCGIEGFWKLGFLGSDMASVFQDSQRCREMACVKPGICVRRASRATQDKGLEETRSAQTGALKFGREWAEMETKGREMGPFPDSGSLEIEFPF
jgi:hypothetical protein